jgi:hypothetical protein
MISSPGLLDSPVEDYVYEKYIYKLHLERPPIRSSICLKLKHLIMRNLSMRL